MTVTPESLMRTAILLESAHRARRDPRSAVISAIFHAIVIGGAVAVTASTGSGAPPVVDEVPLPLYPAPAPEPAPPRRAPEPPRTPEPSLPTVADAEIPSPDVIAPPIVVPDGIPLPATPLGAGDFTIAPPGTGVAPADATGSGGAGVAPFAGDAVDVAVMPKRGNPTPRYPETLRVMRLTGTVVVEYVVSAEGRVEPQSVRAVSSPHELFTAAVRQALERSRFVPAEVAGKPVRQLVRQEFVFDLR